MGGAEAIVPVDFFLVVRTGCRRRAGIGVVIDQLVTQGGDGQRVAGCTDPGSRAAAAGVASHGGNRRRAVGVVAIRRVIALGVGLGWHHRRIQVGGILGHERVFVAEVAIRRVVGRVGDHLAQGRRAGPGVENRARIVHAGDHHVGGVAGRIRRVDIKRRVGQPVENTPLIRVQPGHFDAVEVLDGDRQVGHGELLAEAGRSRVEFGREVVQDESGEARGCRRLGPDEEVGLRLHLVFEVEFLAVAQVAGSAGERRHLARFRRDAHVIGDHAQRAHARRRQHGEPTGSEAADIVGAAHIRGRIGGAAAAAVGRVGVIDGRLVGHDEDVAQAGKLHCDRGDEVVADQDVLVFLLDDFITRRRYHLEHVLAGREAHQGLSRRLLRRRQRMGRGIGRAGELVQAVIRGRLYLVERVQAVIALVQAIVRQGGIGIQVLLGAGKGIGHERVGRILAGAAHVRRQPIGPGALGPGVPAAGLGGVDQGQGLRAIGSRAFLIKVDGDARDQRFPQVLEQLTGVVEGPRRGVHDVTAEAAILTGDVGLLAPLEDCGLAEEVLHAFHDHRAGIDAAGRDRRRRCAGGDAGRGIGQIALGALRIALGAVDRAGDSQIGGHRQGLCGVDQALIGAGVAVTRGLGPVDLSAGIDDDMHAGVLEACVVRFGHIPVEQGEGFVEVGVAVDVRQQAVVELAIAHPDPARHLNQSELARILDAIAVAVQEGVLPDVRLPGKRRVIDAGGAAGGAAGDIDRFGGAVHDQVEPLVEHLERPVAVGNPGELELAVLIALGEGEVQAVGIAQAGVALGMGKRLIVFGIARGEDRAIVKDLAVRTRHVQVRDRAIDGVVAIRAGGAERGLAGVDDFRVGHAEKHVEAARSELLEVGGFTRPQEGVQEVGAVQRVGLQPFLASSFPRGRGMHGDAEAARHQVLDHDVANQG